MSSVATLDFQVTSRCMQACPGCTALPGAAQEADTQAAAAVVRKVRALGVPRIVFAGGDPVLRRDLGLLLRLARQEQLESILATPGDVFSAGFLRAYGRWIDQIAFPLDGPNEAVSSRRKHAGHFQMILGHLGLLKAYPDIDVKIDIAVTRSNLDSVPELVALLDQIAATLPNRLTIDVYQADPAAPQSDPAGLVVSDEEFESLRARVQANRPVCHVRWLDRRAPDGVRLTVLPDGRLFARSGGQLRDLGPLTAIRDLDAALEGAGFEPARHLEHARTWSSRRREAADAA